MYLSYSPSLQNPSPLQSFVRSFAHKSRYPCMACQSPTERWQGKQRDAAWLQFSNPRLPESVLLGVPVGRILIKPCCQNRRKVLIFYSEAEFLFFLMSTGCLPVCIAHLYLCSPPSCLVNDERRSLRGRTNVAGPLAIQMIANEP